MFYLMSLPGQKVGRFVLTLIWVGLGLGLGLGVWVSVGVNGAWVGLGLGGAWVGLGGDWVSIRGIFNFALLKVI